MDTAETPAPADLARPGGDAREAIAIGLVFAVLVAAGGWWAFGRSPVVDQRVGSVVDLEYANYVGDSACSRCHAGESAAHSRSGHARTLRPVEQSPIARRVLGQAVEDPELPGVRWEFVSEGGKILVEAAEGKQEPFRSVVEYAFGSGHHATTFVTLQGREPTKSVAFEHRLTYFAHLGGLGLTPGHVLGGSSAAGLSPHGRVHTPNDTLRCFECHATVTSDRPRGSLDQATMIPNVSCERCHGPGRSHVEAATRGAPLAELAMPRGHGVWTAAEQMSRCGECHRTPSMVKAGSIRTDNAAMVRHQPVGLAQSACFQKSDGALSCTTCHDPHAKSSTDRPSYEANCLSCHQGAGRTPCPVSPASGCVDCHMPRRDIGRGMMLTDHWIRRKP